MLQGSVGRSEELRSCLELAGRISAARVPLPSADSERRWRRLLTIRAAEEHQRRQRRGGWLPARQALSMATGLAVAVLMLTLALGASASLGYDGLVHRLLTGLSVVEQAMDPDAGAAPGQPPGRHAESPGARAERAGAGHAGKVAASHAGAPDAAPAPAVAPAGRVKPKGADRPAKSDAAPAKEKHVPLADLPPGGGPPAGQGPPNGNDPPIGHGAAAGAGPPDGGGPPGRSGSPPGLGPPGVHDRHCPPEAQAAPDGRGRGPRGKHGPDEPYAR